jgi:hypothetical protein
MGFSAEEGRVRIDFFKDGGKWYQTEDVNMDDFYCGSTGLATQSKAQCYSLPEAIIAAMRADLKFRRDDGTFRYAGCWAIVLEPYHEWTHPQMFRVPERFDVP